MNTTKPENSWLTCDCCGEAKEDVEETIDPFYEDVYNEIVECCLCADCYREACNDI